MKIIIDFSPIIYGALFSGTNEARTYGTGDYQSIPKISITNGKYNLKEYKDIVIKKIFNDLKNYKNKFNDLNNSDLEIIIATDTPDNGYWRKDIWEGYKDKRKDTRDNSDIDWNQGFELFNEIREVLRKCSSFKLIEVPRTEGDDIIFVLSEYFSLNNENVIIVSNDHDFIQTLKFNNVKFWRTTQTNKNAEDYFYKGTEAELNEVINKHIIQGDLGDGFGNVKHYSEFSKDFLEAYPQYKGKEKEFYPKRYKIDKKFKEKYGTPAYKKTRYGYKQFLKSKKTIKELLSENPIYSWNYEMNSKLALPEHIPSEIKSQIIQDYNKSNGKRDNKCLSKFFMENKCSDLIGILPLL